MWHDAGMMNGGSEWHGGGWLLAAAALLAVWCGMPCAWAQGSTALVTGAERVFVRRGPGLQFPPFATLTDGSTVEVQEVRGEWARISTANGQVGYVNSNFLALPGEHRSAHRPTRPPPPAPTATPVPAATVTATEATATEGAAAQTLAEQNKTLEAELQRLREQLATMEKTRPDAPPPLPVAAMSPETPQLNTQLAQLTAAVEALQHRVELAAEEESARPKPFPLPENPPQFISPSGVLLAFIGVVAGWLMGSAYGRRHERGRRARVRL